MEQRVQRTVSPMTGSDSTRHGAMEAALTSTIIVRRGNSDDGEADPRHYPQVKFARTRFRVP